MNQVVLLLGGNLGDRKMLLIQAIKEIEKNCGSILKKSKIYESEAWGFECDENFLNQAIVLETLLSPFELLLKLQHIEKELGRKEKTNINQEYSSRLIDIDILFFNTDIIDNVDLTIPHPRMHLRKFTLDCLLDIAPGYIHPVLDLSIEELSQKCNDNTKVWQYA
jgi:2-amino-4-hydroxy-6-hydroxymethyldihydropteridine diphosphokinase